MPNMNPDGSLDIVTSNGTIHLSPEQAAAVIASLSAPTSVAPMHVPSSSLPSVAAPPGSSPINFSAMLATPPTPPPPEAINAELVSPEAGQALDALKARLKPFMSLTGCAPDVYVERWQKGLIQDRSDRAWKFYDEAEALVQAARVVTDAGIAVKIA